MVNPGTRWNPFLKQLVTIALIVGAVWLAFRARAVIAPAIIALLLAYVVSLPVEWLLRRTGWSRTPVVAVTQLVIVALVLTVPAAIAPWFVNAVGAFGNTLVKVVQELLSVTPKPIAITPSLTIDLGPFYQPINQWLRSTLGPDGGTLPNLQGLMSPFASGAAFVVRSAVSGIVWGLFVMVLAFYVVRDGPWLGRWIGARIPDEWRPELSHVWRELVQIWDGFVRGQLLMGLIIGLVVWISMSILGVRNAPILGLISGILEFIPAVGPVIAAVPGVTIALFLGSSWLPVGNVLFALLVTLTYIVIQQTENLYLLPKVVGRRVRLHPAVVIVGALAGNQMAGVLGILLAAPTIAAARLLLGYIFSKLFDLEPFPPEEAAPDRSVVWGELVRERRIRGVLFDLDGTLVETDDRAVRELAGALHFADRVLPEKRRIVLARRYLMLSEGPVNRTVTLLDRVGLDDFAFKVRRWMLRGAGAEAPSDCGAVEGVADTLRILRSRQYLLGVVTSRERREAEAMLAAAGLWGLIGVLVSRDEVTRLKPHPMSIKAAAVRLGVPVTQCVMVGDTSVDIRAAKAAGALAVGVLCGFGADNDFREADLLVDSTAALVKWL